MLEVKELSVQYEKENLAVKAVDNVSFGLANGEILGIAGESGSGKSTIALALMRLIQPPGRITGGEVFLDGQDLLKMPEAELIKVRGARISMVFQDPFTSLNPVFTVGEQIAESIRLHQGFGRKEAWSRAVEMLDLVRIKDPGSRSKDYPHQFSGGMRQRVMIAMALACQPELLIADEPTTALDATIQAEIVRLFLQIQAEFKISIIYISHSFGIIKALCHRVVVVNQGRVMEAGGVGEVLARPRSGYTQKLLDAVTALNPRLIKEVKT